MKGNKFILYDLQLLCGEVEFHSELLLLVEGDIDKSKIKGGGWYHVHKKTKSLYFYGESQSYGKCAELDFVTAIGIRQQNYPCKGKIKKIVFSTKEYLSDVLKENE